MLALARRSVKRTALSLSIDLDGPRISGAPPQVAYSATPQALTLASCLRCYSNAGVAELDILTPPAEVKHIGFHATGLQVLSVTVDGAALRLCRFRAARR